MYAIWTKLTSIEDVLIGNADEVVAYLQTNYSSLNQLVHSTFSERAAHLKRNYYQELPSTSSSFRLLHEQDFPFDSLCEYIGFVFCSYNGKSEFTLNEQLYRRGDIIIEDITNIPNSSSILRSHTRNQQSYHNLFKSFLHWYFKKANYERFVGVGITYEQYKWKFDAFVIGSDLKRSPFSLEEHCLLEMCVLTWTKHMSDQISIRDNARKMLNEQLDYVKGLLETQRADMEDLWTPEEMNVAIKIFEHECQDEIDALFQTTRPFNTFTHVRDQVQSNKPNILSSVAEIFEHCRSVLTTQSFESFLCQVWQQLRTIEYWLRRKDLKSLLNFLHSNSFPSINPLFSISAPLFLDQLGILPESDAFDSASNYIGLLIYLYNDRDEFILNKHLCKRGQILIYQKEKINQFVQAPSYRQTSFAPLIVHECLYEMYFREKPDELFQGIGFVYEQGNWKFDTITYAGKHGIHSTYDTMEENRMASSIDEQRCIDLVLSTIYINNKWKEEPGCMYTIDELEAIGRQSFRKEMEIIEELFESEQTNVIILDKNGQQTFQNFVEHWKPEASMKPITPKIDRVLQRQISPDSLESTKDPQNEQILVNSDTNRSSKSTATFYTSVNDFSQPIEPSSTSPSLNRRAKPQKPRPPPKTAFSNILGAPRRRSSSQDSSSTSKPLFTSVTSISPNELNPNFLPKDITYHRRDSMLSKEKEPRTLYQLYKELHDAEQKILYNSDLTQFLQYLQKKEYINYSDTVPFVPPVDEAEEYNLMAKMKIDAQLKFIEELFQLRRTKLFSQQSSSEKKHFDELFKAFKGYYEKQIERAKKYSKSKL